MGFLIDSSVLIAGERGDLDLEAALKEVGDEHVAIAAITASEILHGVHRAKTERQRRQRAAYVEALLETLPVLAFDLVAARIHARLQAERAQRGESVGAHDLVIAATAVSRGWTIVTRDERSFPRMTELDWVRW